MLVLDDEPQRGVKLVDSFEAGCRPAQTAFEGLPLVTRERREQLFLRGEPAIQCRPGDPGLGGDVGQAELAFAVAAEDLSRGREDPLLRRGVAFDGRRLLHTRNFTKFGRSVTLFWCHRLGSLPGP